MVRKSRGALQTQAQEHMSDAKWEAGTLRVSLFTAEPIEPSLNVWADLFGGAPDQEETRPRDGFKRQAGVWRSTQAEIHINPQRVDVFLGPAPLSPLPGQTIAIQVGIGPFEEAVNILSDIIQPWLKTLKFSAQRVGFGGQAIAEAADREEAYKILSNYIKSVAIDAENMREFFYRVNWRIGSNAVDYFNRMTTWSAPMVTFQLEEHTGERSPILNQRQFAQFEFDMNTPFEHQRGLEPDTLNAIFTQLVALALEVAADGEPVAKP